MKDIELVEMIEKFLLELKEIGYRVTFNTLASIRAQVLNGKEELKEIADMDFNRESGLTTNDVVFTNIPTKN